MVFNFQGEKQILKYIYNSLYDQFTLRLQVYQAHKKQIEYQKDNFYKLDTSKTKHLDIVKKIER